MQDKEKLKDEMDKIIQEEVFYSTAYPNLTGKL